MIRKKENKFIAYIHKNSLTGEIFYVGIGIKGREKQRRKRSQRWTSYVQKYGFVAEVLRSGINWSDACVIEKQLITLYGRKDLGAGNLINMTNGGDGSGGHKGFWGGKSRPPASKETIEKCRQNSAKPFLGRKHSEETKKKIKEKRALQDMSNRRGKTNRIPWNKGIKMWENREHPKGMKGKVATQETRDKKSKALSKWHAENEYTQERKMLIGKAHRGKSISPEVRLKISESVKKYYESAEY